MSKLRIAKERGSVNLWDNCIARLIRFSRVSTFKNCANLLSLCSIFELSDIPEDSVSS